MNWTVRGAFPLVGEPVKVGMRMPQRPTVMKPDFVTVLLPPAFVDVSRMLYCPRVVKVKGGFCAVENWVQVLVPTFWYSHFHEVGLFVD
jgi:hypothetical protein